MNTFQTQDREDFERYINIVTTNQVIKTEKQSFIHAINHLAEENGWQDDIPALIRRESKS